MGNNSASILARLKNESIKRGIPNQQMITLFLQEEFSRRLGKSKYIDKFVLKGAERITEQNDYHGLRLKLVGAIGRSKTPIFIDIAIGDVIIPESCIISFETKITGF